MSKNDKSEIKARVISSLFRMNFPKLDVPKAFDDKKDAKLKFSTQMLFDPAKLADFNIDNGHGGFDKVDITKLCKDLAYQKWPDIKGDPDAFKEHFRKLKGGSNWPIRKGETVIAELTKKNQAKGKKVPDLSYLEGMVQINASSNEEMPPVLSYKEAGKTVELDRSNPDHMRKIKKLFTGGNYAIAELTVIPQETDAGHYITFYLNHVVFRKEGERLGGGGGLMSRFDGIDGGETDFDPEEDDFGSDDI